MRKIVTVGLMLTAAAAFGLPRGLAGPSVGFGGILGDQAFVGGEIDFASPPYISWGPEAMLAFGGGVAVFGGVAGRVYLIPNYNYLAQPYFVFGGGLAIGFDTGDEPEPPPGEDDTDVHPGGYVHFGAGTDFDIPNTAIVPYIDLGGLVFITDNTDADFKIEIGIRFGR